MDDSAPRRRSTRSSVVSKTEELTPKKRRVSTTAEPPLTPSRRSTRASSATPKKNLIESLSTPKKALPVLNEEETTATTSRTPAKKTKDISPKTPSRRRLVRESVSNPTRGSNDKSTKKPVETSEEINVNLNRPLTRAKRKTMGEVHVEEVTKTTESEKAVQNKKDKSASPDKSVQKKTDKSASSDNDDKTIKSPDSKVKDESSLALVPKVVLTDLKKEESQEAEKIEEENECGTFTTKSPVRAEEVAINSPRKVPENCKSISEASLISDSEYIDTKSKKVAADTSNASSSVEKSDVSPIEDVMVNSSVNITSVPDILATSPKKVIDSKDDIPNIIITSPSPRKASQSKDNKIPNIVVTSPSPRKTARSKDIKNSSDSSQQISSPIKSETNPSAVAKDNNTDELKTLTSADVNSETTNMGDGEEVNNLANGENSDQPICQVSSDEIPQGTKEKSIDAQTAEIENKESNETSDKIESNDNAPDSAGSISAKEVSVEKPSDSDSQLLTNRNNVPVADANEAVTEEDATRVEIENSNELNESKLISTADDSFALNISDLDESHVEDSNEEVNTLIPAVEEPVTTPVENGKSEKDESKVIEAGLSSSDVSFINEDEKAKEIPNSPAPITSESNAGAVGGEGTKHEASSASRIVLNGDSECETSDDSRDSGIQNDTANSLIMKPRIIVPLPLKRCAMEVNQEAVDIEEDVEDLPNSTDPLDETKVSENGIVEESSTGAENVQNIPLAIEDKKETMPENLLESSVSTSLDETLMAANEFLNSDEECNMDSQKSEESDTTIESNSSDENKPSEDVTKSDVEPAENPISQTEDNVSLNATQADVLASQGISPDVLKKQDDCVVVKEPSGSETLNSPDKNEQTTNLPSGNEQKDAMSSETNNSPDNNEQESLTNPISPRSPDKKEQTTNLPSTNEHKDAMNSETTNSPGKKERKSLDNSETKNTPGKKERKNFDNSETKNTPGAKKRKNLDNSENMSSPVKKERKSLDSSETKSTPGKKKRKSLDKSETINSPGRSLDDVETTNSPGKHEESPNDSKTINSPGKKGRKSLDESETKNSPGKKGRKSLDESETKNSPGKKGRKSLDESETKNSPGKKGRKSLDESETKNSPGKKGRKSLDESETKNSPGKKGRKSLDESETKNSPGKKGRKSLDESETKNSPRKKGLKSVDKSETKNSPRKNLDESETKNSPGKNLDDAETMNSPGKNEESLSDSETKNSPVKHEESPNDSETINSPGKKGRKSLDESETKNSPRKNLDESETKNSPGKNLYDAETINSPGKKGRKNLDDAETMNSPGKNEESLNDSQAIKSPGKAERKSLSDSEHDKNEESGSDVSGSRNNFDLVKKTTKPSKKKRRPIAESETESSQSDLGSDTSYNAPSDIATEGSSEHQVSGKDFIEFEAEEGEETPSEDDSFIVDTDDLSEESASSSDTPKFNLKVRRRRVSVDGRSPDSRQYTDFVKSLADSSEDDKPQDSFLKNKKRKLDKNITVNKKSGRPKSILRNKETIVEPSKNKNTTDNKVVQELSKAGVFIVSSISQDSEEPELPRKTKTPRLCTEWKRSTISKKDGVPKGFTVSGKSGEVGDEVALRGFVVSNEESYLEAKKPRKTVSSGSELISRKKKTKKGKVIKKAVKKPLRPVPIDDDFSGEDPPYVATLMLPSSMKAEKIIGVLTDKGITDISSIDLPKSKVAIVVFSSKQHFEKTLELYGELKYNNKPIYVLEGSTYI